MLQRFVRDGRSAQGRGVDLIYPVKASANTLFVLKMQLYLGYSSIKCYYIIAKNLFGGIEDDGKTGIRAV